MITYNHKGLGLTGKALTKLPVLGWVQTAKTPAGGIAVLAVKDYGKGYETREQLRVALKGNQTCA